MAYTASAMAGAAALDGLIEGFLPGDPKFAVVPVAFVLVLFVFLLAVGPRLSRRGLALVGPFGVALIAYALATSPGPGDGAILYALPVLWTTIFFGRRGAVAIVACVGVGEAVALLLLPAASAYPGRWVDVMVSTSAIAVVAHVLENRSQVLLERLRSEARTDPLTGLLNRRGFDEHAARELARAGRDGRPIALATFDIDHFKQINDEHGHVVGDRALVHIAHLLASPFARNRRHRPARWRGVRRAHARQRPRGRGGVRRARPPRPRDPRLLRACPTCGSAPASPPPRCRSRSR